MNKFYSLCFLTFFPFFLSAQNEIEVDIRCNTVPYNEKLKDNHKENRSDQDFEKWMTNELKKLRKSQNRMEATYTIPIIFHVIHNGQTEGATQNVSSTYIEAQLDQLNEDFANLSGSTEDAAADIEIDFCLALIDEDGNVLDEPGINRVHRDDYGFSTPPWTDTYVDNTIKPNSQWDPTQYFNVWVLDISGGILGWAQFPEAGSLQGIGTGNGDADTDGVVILYSSVGSTSTPFGDPPYDKGRTLTHEVGHWLGLRHIWGDGNCNVDDYCDDTPLASGSNFGCPNVNSCNDGNPNPPDMVENYMDYTDDDCMNTFTVDQKDRMHVVMGATGDPSPRRAELDDSTVCNADPCFSFVDSSIDIVEGSDCNDMIVTVEVNLNLAINDDATVNIAVIGSSTADAGDYTLGGTSLVFPNGFVGNKSVDLTINADEILEPDETIIIEITSIVGTSTGSCNSNDLQINILNDDIMFSSTESDYEFLTEDFNSSPSGWTVTDGGSTTDTWETSTTHGGNDLDNTNFAFINSDAAGSGSTSYEILLSPIINTQSATTLNLEFDQYFRRYNQGYEEQITVDVWNGSSWQNVYTRTESDGNIGGWDNPNQQNIDILAHKSADMQLRFIYDGEYDWWWAIDNVKIIGDKKVDPATQINSSSGYAEHYIGPMETVYFSDQNAGEVMMKIENLSSHDYGCTKVEIVSEGVNVFNAGTNGKEIADKTYLVTPTNNTASGNLNITLYYDESEVDYWVNMDDMGCEDIADLKIISSNTSIAAATGDYTFYETTLEAFNTDHYAFSANVSDVLGGFGLSDQINESRLYVKHDASGFGSGGSFENAILHPSDALIKARTCSNINEIRIAGGNYLPYLDNTENVPSSSSDYVFFIDQDITIYGSFEGTDTSLDNDDLSLRDFENNATVFNGDINMDDGNGQYTDNAKRIVEITNATSNMLLIDGVQISNAKNGSVGGGIHCLGGVSLKNIEILDCEVTTEGGAMYLGGNENIILEDIMCEGNSPNDIYSTGSPSVEMRSNVRLKE